MAATTQTNQCMAKKSLGQYVLKLFDSIKLDGGYVNTSCFL